MIDQAHAPGGNRSGHPQGQPQQHAALMDGIYRWNRHVYDASRKFFLFGRDSLIAGLQARPGEHILEIGCGTARNLVLLNRLAPDAVLYGVDASSEMLLTAESNLRRAGLPGRVALRQGLAEELRHGAIGPERGFDAVFFSYALTMIPPWSEAVEAAIRVLRPGGRLHIVDFWDQAMLPAPFRKLLTWWLAKFHVHHRAGLLPMLERLKADGRLSALEVDPIAGRYAYVIRAVVA
jgi:S-adenosylmethionine-diacylgycerolhomoserine-N-methlytransferase